MPSTINPDFDPIYLSLSQPMNYSALRWTKSLTSTFNRHKKGRDCGSADSSLEVLCAAHPSINADLAEESLVQELQWRFRSQMVEEGELRAISGGAERYNLEEITIGKK